MASPESLIAELIDRVRSAGAPLAVRGGGSKPGLCGDSPEPLDLRPLSGIVAYEPSEFTLTALAGTPLVEIEAALREHGQRLPFDPPFAATGATAGGVVAAGLSGPGRLRHGGVRDAVLAVRYVDGLGRHVRAGAPVVKNAAGFDVPKLLVGSLGRLAVLTEVCFKVLPRPESQRTGLVEVEDTGEVRRLVADLLRGPLELDGLDVLCDRRLAMRLGGRASALDTRMARLERTVGRSIEILEDDAELWQRQRDGGWASGDSALVRLAMTARSLPELSRCFGDLGATAVFAAGLSSAWVAVSPGDLAALAEALEQLELCGLVVRDAPGSPSSEGPPWLGQLPSSSFLRRVKSAMDPKGRFLPFEGE